MQLPTIQSVSDPKAVVFTYYVSNGIPLYSQSTELSLPIMGPPCRHLLVLPLSLLCHDPLLRSPIPP